MVGWIFEHPDDPNASGHGYGDNHDPSHEGAESEAGELEAAGEDAEGELVAAGVDTETIDG